MRENETKATPSDAPPKPAALLAEFDGPEALRSAAATLRESGLRHFDAHSPFPVHGMERAMGIRPTILPWLVLGGGITGAAAALLLQWWTNAYDYPWIVSGKPYFSLPANIPIVFELIVLLSALGAFGFALLLNRLPQFSHPVFDSERFRRATTDGFFLSVEARDPKFDEAATTELLRSAGATAVETCYDPAAGARLPGAVGWAAVTLLVLALLPPILIARYRYAPKKEPRIHPVQDMDFQPKYLPQAASPLFADGRAMRPPVPGAIGAAAVIDNEHLEEGKVDGQWATTFPMPVDMDLADRGQQRFNIYCAVCHGLAGDGGASSIVSARAAKRGDSTWIPPASLHSPSIIEQPVGQIFGTITNGVRSMPAYGPQIPPEDRWAIVLYVRALERSQNAEVKDVPPEIRPQLR